MESFIIKTGKLNEKIEKPHFFILNKGLNAGKPMQTACPNCFVLVVENKIELDFYFWLTYGLWRSKSFQYYLRGSVIPFITINDFRSCLMIGKQNANTNSVKFNKSIELLKLLDNQEKQFRQNLKLIEEARKAVFYKILKPS